MTYAEFQERYERMAGAEYDAYMARSAAELVVDASAGRFGEYYQLWRAIASKATLGEAGRVLLDVVRGPADYLVRYHAADALLALLQTTVFEAVDLTGGRDGGAERLDVVERLLRERLAADTV